MQTLYRFVGPKGELRPDGARLRRNKNPNCRPMTNRALCLLNTEVLFGPSF